MAARTAPVFCCLPRARVTQDALASALAKDSGLNTASNRQENQPDQVIAAIHGSMPTSG